MYSKCGGVAAYHVVCIGLCLSSVRVCVFLLVLWLVLVLKLSDITTCTVQIQSVEKIQVLLRPNENNG